MGLLSELGPGLLSAGAGGGQGVGEGLAQLLNLFRREGIAGDIEQAGGDAAADWSRVVDPLFDRSEGRLGTLGKEGDVAFDRIGGILRGGKFDALD